MAKKELTQEISFAPKQDSCHVLVDGKYIGTSPLNYKLGITQDHTITYAKMSYLPLTFHIESKRNSKWVIRDILAGGIILSPLTLRKDKKTKAWNELDSSNLPLELTHWEQALPPTDYLNTLFQIEDLYFAPASDRISNKHFKKIEKLLAIFKKYPEVKVIIHGHSDKNGNETNNNSLSVKRAEAVKKYLMTKGMKNERIITVGHGSSSPIYEGKDEKEFYNNRRVEFEYVL
jgi:outer membrane protein OmpA-like peptidoglycan-associated protein